MTNPVHKVLNNHELLTTICKAALGQRGTIGAAALFSLSLVSRGISEATLDVLWRAIDIEVVCFTFPENIFARGEDGVVSWILEPITVDQWSRFHTYAGRIRDAYLDTWDNNPMISGLCAALGGLPPHLQPPFPRLATLVLYLNLSGSLSIRTAVRVLSATLTDVTIMLEGTEAEGHQDVADFLRALGDRCKLLRKFVYHDGSEPMDRSDDFDMSLTYLITRSSNLRTVELPLSRTTLAALSRLPSLTSLTMDNVPRSVARTPSSGPLKNEPPCQDMFIALEDLSLSLCPPYSVTDYITDLFQCLGCVPRKTFKIEISVTPTPSETAEFIRLLHYTMIKSSTIRPLSATLESFNVSCGGLGCSVPWESFKWLLSLRCLRHVNFDGFCFDITDMDLEEISRTWRNLRTLHFEVPRRKPEGYTPQITFHGLAHLSKLPELRHVSLGFNVDARIAPSMLSTRTLSTSALTTLHIVGKFPDIQKLQFTMFLAKNFPNLKEVAAAGHWHSEGLRSFWRGVTADLKIIQPVLASTRNA